ncbi:hypothetical protein RJ639_000337 [Escallonia herrerae]|uniref:Protein kinase domain-containing protein n=1 Tax=Escallonia herrerae TaxID=1293975 RepID=A0AA89BRZ2_9ASTE|nr:hypothetical protein RJ639_000337 [Escallonia herrerae]
MLAAVVLISGGMLCADSKVAEPSMEKRGFRFWRLGLLVLVLLEVSSATLSPSGVNYEVVALMAIKNELIDPYNVLENWDITSVDPCSWRMVTCSPDGYVSALGLPSQSLSGKLSPGIGNLSNLKSVLLQNNAISGSIPAAIGRLEKLQTLDLSSNKFIGEIPSPLGDLNNLNYLDLSFNNLSGSLPKVSARTFKIIGNPLICGLNSANNCSVVSPEPLSFPPDGVRAQSASGRRSHRVAIAFGASFGAAFLLVIVIGLLVWLRYRHNQQIFFDVNDQYDPEVCLGHLRRYSFKELRSATDHFNSKNILGRGGFGIVYKGCSNDGTVMAVKRLKDYNTFGGEIQFQTEVELISLAVHRNLLRLWGFCSTENERLLVYPYMPNGSVASRLRGTARGLLYLHEQCDPKIIHRDVKAANILLDEDFEAVVGDFGLAKLLDHRDSHVTTAVRGTVGHIAPEYLSTGQSSEKTDVFGFGILLLELITDGLPLEGPYYRGVSFCSNIPSPLAMSSISPLKANLFCHNLKRVAETSQGFQLKPLALCQRWMSMHVTYLALYPSYMLCYFMQVKQLHQDGKLNLMVDKDLKNNFDRVELEEMVQVALLCTKFNPSNRPKMSEILRMLEGDGLAEKWEASQSVDTPRYRTLENNPQRYSDFLEESSHVVEAMELSGPR